MEPDGPPFGESLWLFPMMKRDCPSSPRVAAEREGGGSQYEFREARELDKESSLDETQTVCRWVRPEYSSGSIAFT